MLSALVEMANKPEYSGSYTYPCLSGGDAEVTAAIDDEEFPYRVTGMWEIEIDECQLGYSDVTIEVGYFAFTSNNVAEAETETRRFEAAVEAWFRWARLPDNRRFRCDRGLTDISGVFEAGLDEPYTGSLDGLFCEEAVEIPVSSFPGNWTF
ncbi:MAG: hypothetical protein OXG58_00145 [Gemmatimonadetes bacterium]|nr:hypothetical protein [Gemmatimonadota bacterium]MCY3943589.1 hypothetical protein [Gemmatimonadota bacterium]